MSKNITIQEGGVAKQLTADKLKTNLVGGGTCLWVPEDETQLGTKIITENGTYKASDDGYYGYSEVTVSGQGTATGTDGDGDEAVAHTNPETGELVVDKVPSSIVVITPPTNPYGIYTDGQSIGTDGMVVKAYLASGGVYDAAGYSGGVIPVSEVTINPTTAVYDASTDTGKRGTATSDLNTSIEQPISYSSVAGHSRIMSDESLFFETVAADACAGINLTGGSTITVLFASSTFPAGYVSRSDGYNYQIGGSPFTYNGKTVYFSFISFNQAEPWTYNGTVNATHGSGVRGEDAWTMVYGAKEEEPAGSRQKITVSWPRPIDSKVLETTFEILVAPPYSTEE